ncbi:MAG: CoA transferase [Dehalococcoidia bacterium]
MTLPLEGYRIIDFTQVWAGPQIGATLGDLGAEVVRVESRSGTDVQRNSPVEKSPMRQLLESQWYYRSRSHYITINLLKAPGVELLKRLVQWSDVLVLNLSPKTQQALGVDYPSLQSVKPGLIMATFSAAGQDGPWSDLLAFGPAISCIIGTESLVGYPGDQSQPMLNIWDPDPGMGVMLGFAILTALYHRERTGQGQLIDLPFTELLPGLLGEAILEYQMTGRVPGPKGNQHPRMAPHEIYPCKDQDTWVSIAVGAEDEWRAMCDAIGQPGLASDQRFSDPYRRLQHRDELDAIVSAWTSQRTHHEATETLRRAGVAASPAFSVADLYHDPHDIERRTSINIETPELRPEDVTYGIPWRLSDTPGSIRRLGRPMGADNHRFFSAEFEMSSDEIDRLVQAQVIY